MPRIWRGASWQPRSESGALGACSDGALGACQPVLGGSSGCRTLCATTLGCVAWTYVHPEMRPDAPTQWCAEEAYPVKVRANLTVGGRCCLQQHWPAVGAVPAPAACCTAGLVASPCREGCRMPWPAVQILDDLAPPAIDQQRRNMIGGDASVRMFPWVGVQQLHLRPSESPHKGRRAARQPREATPRVAVCVAGAARALIHPLVWRSLERHVLGRSEGGEGGHDLFAVLGTGAEDQRSRTNELPLDEQPSLRSAAGAYLLSHALSALRPKAVRLVVGTANASCGIPASGQFSKWADCVDSCASTSARGRCGTTCCSRRAPTSCGPARCSRARARSSGSRPRCAPRRAPF